MDLTDGKGQQASDMPPVIVAKGTFTDGERLATLAGVAIVFLLAALDQTVVSTAMPRIIADLHGLVLYSWVTTAYLLTSTVMVPIWGKLGDLIGRKPVLLASIGLFLLGSSLSGLSGEFGDMPLLGGGMIQLVVFRAVQGIGGGGLFTTAYAIIADIYPPRERARLGGLLGAVFALSSTLGPLLGGYFTDHGTVEVLGHWIAGWRWVFYLNLPLAVISLVLIVGHMPTLSRRGEGKIDVVGALLLVATVVPLLLALTFGGNSYGWTSLPVIGLFAGAGVALSLYVFCEKFAIEPVLPIALFRNATFASTNLATFLVSMSFMSTVAFLPLFMQLAQGLPATTSGLSILPLIVGIIGSSVVVGRVAARHENERVMAMVSVAVTFAGIFLLSRMGPETGPLDLSCRMLVLGMGLGPAQSLFGVILQNAFPSASLGVVTSSNQFFRQIGATVGVALFGSLLNSNLNLAFAHTAPGMSLTKLQGLFAQRAQSGISIPDDVRWCVATAINHTFAFGMVILCVALVVVSRIPLQRPPQGN